MIPINEIYQEEEQKLEEEKFRVTDKSSADWCFRKIKQIRKKLEEDIGYADDEILRFRTWKTRKIDQANESIEFFESLLQDYYDREIEKDDKFKLSTAVGSAYYRTDKKWNYGNENALLERLKMMKLDDFIRTKESINKSELKKNVIVTDTGKVATKDGEILEGIEVTENKNFQIRL